MSKKKVTKKIMALGGMFCISAMMILSPVSSLSAQANSYEETMVQPRKDDIQWRYKIENNKVYKRLYNYSIADWVGDWIYVRDLT